MNFFKAQDEARGRTAKLVSILILAVLSLAGSLYVLAVIGETKLGLPLDWWQPRMFLATSGLALAVILGGSLLKIVELSKGGSAVAASLGARLVSPYTTDTRERRYLNVVQEMSLASGMPVPDCYVMDGDDTINAFAAGNDPKDAVVGVTVGALKNLNRDELQGVIAHEFSHIANGDMRLNIKIIGMIAGLTALAGLGYILLRLGLSSRSSNEKKSAWPLALAGLVVLIVGWMGMFFARIIQSSVSRQREYLADASAVQFTRNPKGLASALVKVGQLARRPHEVSVAQLEAQHLFFSSSGSFLDSLFATHPPLADRIQRIDPSISIDLSQLSSAERSDEPDEAELADSPLLGFNSRTNSFAPSLPERIPSDLEIQEAVRFKGKIPSELRTVSQEPIGAMAIVLGLILRQDPVLRTAQIDSARSLASGEVVKQALTIEPLLTALPAGSRVPLLDLAMPALRQLSATQVSAFRAAIKELSVGTEDGIMVMLIHASMRRYLSVAPDALGSQPNAITVPNHFARVLSAVVITSSESPMAQQKAYRLGASVLGLEQSMQSMLTSEQVNLDQVQESLSVISGLGVNDRRSFVRACGVAMLNDQHAEPAEIEIVRAVADSLGITFAS
jgi:Zn-dependent protease with chaperone function